MQTLLLGCALAFAAVAAQDLTISSIKVPGPAFTAGTPFLSTVDFSTPDDAEVALFHNASFELMAGPKSDSQNKVIDLMCLNADTFVLSCQYTFSRSIPAGEYHFRVNITNNTVPSTLSDTFRIAAFAHDCTPPPAWTPITSPSDPHYTSLRIESPPAGYATPVGPGRSGSVVVGWDYIDRRNNLDKGISSMVMEFVNSKTGKATGLYRWKSSDLLSTGFDFAGTDVSVGTWRIRANYSNTLEGSPPGSTVTSLSEEFYITGPNGNCQGIGRKPLLGGSRSKHTRMPWYITLLAMAILYLCC